MYKIFVLMVKPRLIQVCPSVNFTTAGEKKLAPAVFINTEKQETMYEQNLLSHYSDKFP